MHLSTSFTFAFSAGAVLAMQLPSHIRNQAQGLVGRDLNTVNNVITQTDDRMKEMTTALQNFNGDPAQLVRASTDLVNTLNQGIKDVNATTPITITEAVGLQGSVTTLQKDATTLITALNDKKGAFQQAGLCDIVYKQAGDIGAVGGQLIGAVLQKVPQEVQSIAAQVVGPFSATLQMSVQNFAPGNCTNGATSVSSAGTGAAAGSGNTSARPSGGMNTPSSQAPAGSYSAPAGLACLLAAAVLIL